MEPVTKLAFDYYERLRHSQEDHHLELVDHKGGLHQINTTEQMMEVVTNKVFVTTIRNSKGGSMSPPIWDGQTLTIARGFE
jgi:hypothetical protein